MRVSLEVDAVEYFGVAWIEVELAGAAISAALKEPLHRIVAAVRRRIEAQAGTLSFNRSEQPARDTLFTAVGPYDDQPNERLRKELGVPGDERDDGSVFASDLDVATADLMAQVLVLIPRRRVREREDRRDVCFLCCTNVHAIAL